MTSAQKRKANRKNAQVSTGPKTARGKARAAQNARRHGLSLSILVDPVRSAELKNIALEIAGEGASPVILEHARRIAEAQIDLLRVRQARNELFARDLSVPECEPTEVLSTVKRMIKTIAAIMRRSGPQTLIPPELIQNVRDMLHREPQDPDMLHRKLQGQEKLLYILSNLTRQLFLLDRYERRALSRRKFAIRDFDYARN